MSAHNCTTHDPNCPRCDLSRDEVRERPIEEIIEWNHHPLFGWHRPPCTGDCRWMDACTCHGATFDDLAAWIIDQGWGFSVFDTFGTDGEDQGYEALIVRRVRNLTIAQGVSPFAALTAAVRKVTGDAHKERRK